MSAELADEPAQKFAAALQVALLVAAEVFAITNAASVVGRRSAWDLLGRVAPELGEWAGFFATVQASTVVTEREADDLVREAGVFLDFVSKWMGRRAGRAVRVG